MGYRGLVKYILRLKHDDVAVARPCASTAVAQKGVTKFPVIF